MTADEKAVLFLCVFYFAIGALEEGVESVVEGRVQTTLTGSEYLNSFFLRVQFAPVKVLVFSNQ